MSTAEETASSSKPKGYTSSTVSSTVSHTAHTVYQWITAIAWEIYKPLLSGPTELIVPEHTRNAFFQLWCDLRTNTPKDRKWLMRHAQALKPHTFPGWIALGSGALFASAGSTALLSLSLAIFAVITYSLVTIVLVSGLTIGFSLLAVSAASIVAAMVTAWFAMCSAAAYAFVASTVAVFSYGLRTFQRTPLGQAQRKAKPSRLAPESPKASSMAKLDEEPTKSSEEDKANAARVARTPPIGETRNITNTHTSGQRSSASYVSDSTDLPSSGGGKSLTELPPLGGVGHGADGGFGAQHPNANQAIGGGQFLKETVAANTHNIPTGHSAQVPPVGNGSSGPSDLLKEKVAISGLKLDDRTI